MDIVSMIRGPLWHPLPPGYSGPADEGNEPEPERDEEEAPVSMDDTLPLDLAPAGGGGASEEERPKIRSFEQKLNAGRHEDNWDRSPNVTGTGAIHVKSFHARLTGDSLEYLDRQINEWLDAHPQYEVKLVTTSVGTWSGKLKEPNLVVNVWV